MTRWLIQTSVGLCCLTLTLAGGRSHGQGVTWARGQVPATVSWQRSVQVEPDEIRNTTPEIRLQAPGVAVIAEARDPVARPSSPSLKPPAIYLPEPVQVPVLRARLGAPVELPEAKGTADGSVPVQYVPPLNRREGTEEFAEGGLLPTNIQLTLPGPHRLFRLDSEAAVHERIRQEARQTRTPTLIEFPEPARFDPREKILIPRQWALTTELVEPCYVNHGRLLFEQINSERYGWSMGIVQPAVSALHFYADVATLPYHLAQNPCRQGDTSAGKCLPGDPVPLYLYPPQWSLSGLSAEAAAVTLLFFIFP